MPVPPHAHQDAPPGATGSEPHPVIAAAYAAARGQTGADGSGGGDPSTPTQVPARHKAPLRPPSRRAWVAVGLLVALTALPMLVVIFAGRAALRGPDDPRPYRADGGPPVVIEPGPDGAHRPKDAVVAPEASGAVSGAAPSGAVGGGAGGGRAEAAPCPTVPGAGAQAAGGGAAPAGGGSPGDGSGADAGSAPGGGTDGAGAPGGGTDGAGAPGGADAGAPGGGAHTGTGTGAPGAQGGASSGDAGAHGGADASSSGDGSSGDDRGGSGHPSPGSTESAPGRNFIERVLDELGIPLP